MDVSKKWCKRLTENRGGLHHFSGHDLDLAVNPAEQDNFTWKSGAPTGRHLEQPIHISESLDFC